MGCYGIGVSRLLAAIAEVSHDPKGLKWPVSVTPFSIAILPFITRQGSLLDKAEEIYHCLLEKLPQLKGEMLLDDRDTSPGQKMREACQLGFPFLVIIGREMEQGNKIELEIRSTGDKHILILEELVEYFKSHLIPKLP